MSEERPYIDAFDYIECLGEKIEDRKLIKINRFLQEDRKKKNKEIERLNNAFDSLEQIIRYYVIDNVKYDNNTAEYILERLLMFWGKDSDK